MSKRRLLLNENQLDIQDLVLSKTNITVDLVDAGGGATYSFTTQYAIITEFLGVRRLDIFLSGINTSGTPTGRLEITFNIFGISLNTSIGLLDYTGTNDTWKDFRTATLFAAQKIVFPHRTANNNFANSITITNGAIKVFTFLD